GSAEVTISGGLLSDDSFIMAMFNAIVAKFESIFHIVFRDGTIEAQQFCAGTTCVNEQQLQQIMQQAGITPAPSVTPSPSPIPLVSSDVSPSPASGSFTPTLPVPSPEPSILDLPTST